MQPTLAWNSRSSWISLLSAGNAGMCYSLDLIVFWKSLPWRWPLWHWKGSWEEDMGAAGIFFSARQRASAESRVSGALDRIKECSWQQAFVLPWRSQLEPDGSCPEKFHVTVLPLVHLSEKEVLCSFGESFRAWHQKEAWPGSQDPKLVIWEAFKNALFMVITWGSGTAKAVSAASGFWVPPPSLSLFEQFFF